MSQSFEEFSKSNLYVLPPPAHAAPLPPGLCPKGDSWSISVLGGLLFSYSESKTRSELECLDRVLAAWRQAPKVEIVSAPLAAAPSIAPAPAAAVSPAPLAANAAPDAAPLPPAPASASATSEPKKEAVAKKPAPKKVVPAKPKASEPDACASAAAACKIPGK